MSYPTFNPYNVFVGSFIPNCIMKCKDLSASDKLVYARLSQYAGKNGTCFPKQETIAEECGLSKRQIIISIQNLENKKFIQVHKPTGRDKMNHANNSYSFLMNDVIKNELNIETLQSEKSAPVESEKSALRLYEENHSKENHKDICEKTVSSENQKIITALQRICLKHYPNNKLPNNFNQSWNKVIIKNMKHLNVTVEYIVSLLKKYYLHFDKTDKYHPVIRSAESLFEKLDKLERFCNKLPESSQITKPTVKEERIKPILEEISDNDIAEDDDDVSAHVLD